MIGVLGFDSRRGLRIFFTTASRTARAHQDSYPMGTRGVKLTAHLHLVQRSMSGPIHQLPQYAFIVWCLVKEQGITLPLPVCWWLSNWAAPYGVDLTLWLWERPGGGECQYENSLPATVENCEVYCPSVPMVVHAT